MEASGDVTGEEVQTSSLDVEIKEEKAPEVAPQEAECQVQESPVESTSILLEEEFEKWANLKNFLGVSGIKSDARLAGFLINFWSDHKDCKQLEKKEKKKKKSKERHEPAAPKIKIPIRMTSRGRPVYKPNILQVKLTSDTRTKTSKRRAALKKRQNAIKKAKIKKREAAKKKRGQAKTKRKVPKVPRKEPKEMKIVWRSDDEEDDDDEDMNEFVDDDGDGDYTPAGPRKPRGLAKLAADTEFSDGELSTEETPKIRRKPKAGVRGRKRVMKRGEKLPPKKRKYLDKSRLKGETWYRCRIKKMMRYTKRFQCKICLQEVTAITEVIDHIQNEHPEQISGFRTSLGPHLERCGLTVVWSLPEAETQPSKGTEGADRNDGSVLKNMTETSGGEEKGNDKNGGEDEGISERAGRDGFAMGGGILKGGYMSLLVGDEANASSREADAQEGDGEPSDNRKKAGEEKPSKEDGVGASGDCRAVAVLEDGQTDAPFKERQSDSQVTSLEEDVDVLYELQGWVVIMIECPECKEYVSIYSLPKHQFLHDKPKQEHRCDVCNKVYRRLNLLRNHQKKHQEKPPKPKEEEKTFMCELCGDVFRKAKYLKNHQLRHQGNLPFVCKICDRRFLFQRQLKRHDIIHRDVKPILCQECGRGFVQRSQLNAHMRQHTGEKPYKCDLCERAFTHNVSLKTHKKRDHGVQVGKCANPHLGRPKMSNEGAPKSKGTRGTSSRKASQARNQTVINTPPASQYSECRMVNPSMNHLPLGLVINPDRQGMDLSLDSSDSPPGIDNTRGAPSMQSRTADRTHRERHLSVERQNTTIHNMDSHSRPNHSEAHGNMEHLGNPHIERSVINMDRHAGNGGEGNSSANSGGSHNALPHPHPHFERAMAMPLIERSLASHLIDRQGLSPPIDSRQGNAHGHHMDHHPHHQGGIPLIARPDLNQHLMRQKKGKELEMPPHQNNPSHPPYPWGAWGNVGEGMGMRFPVFPQ